VESVKNILGKRELSKLGEFVTPDTLVAFDFDGTLAPLARDPRAAQLRKSTARLLGRIAERYPTAVISGRPRADVLARLSGAKVRAVVGNHGIEPSPDAPRYHTQVKAWMPILREALADLQGVEIENKLYSVTIHYRRSRAKTKARSVIDQALTKLPDARAIEGRLLVNVLPAAAPNKGSALAYLRTSLNAEHAVFVGDDLSADELFSQQANHLLGIRVGRATGSSASHYLAKQADIDSLLKRLLELHGADKAVSA
jgi:trehalose 6-phosphate phosphatase